MSRDPMLSVVVPLCNEEEMLPHYLAEVQPVLDGLDMPYELVFVDDGSTDKSFSYLKGVSEQDSRIKVVRFSRNFGKEAANQAGFDHARGEAVLLMAADLEDPPEVIPEMIKEWRSGVDVVYSIRRHRKDPLFKKITAKLFYKIIDMFSDITIYQNAGDFRLFSRPVIDAIGACPERGRFSRGIYNWVGFNAKPVYYDRPMRSHGQTKFNVMKMFSYGMQGLISFTTFPLKVWTFIGALVSLGSFFYAAYLVYITLVFGADVPGYASLAVFLLFFNGLILINLGVMGMYLSRVFDEVKQRPLYIVRETLNR